MTQLGLWCYIVVCASVTANKLAACTIRSKISTCEVLRSACLYVCLSVSRSLAYLKNHMSKLHEIFVR